MSEYRFHLEKYRCGSKIDCPSCGKKHCFVRYVDEQGTVRFPPTVGKCDHEQSCGYHYTPREYFRDTPEALSNDNRSIGNVFRQSVIHTRPIPTEPSYIPDKIVLASLSHYDSNPLYRYLCCVFGAEETARLFNLYHIGTSAKWGGSTVFWQTDESGKVRTVDRAGLWLNAGTMYGAEGEGFLRWNIACPRAVLLEGLNRFADFVHAPKEGGPARG